MNKSLLFLSFSLLILTGGCRDKSFQPLSFIIIQLDDLGWDDLAIHGNRVIQTPNIDRLAEQSMQFTRFYVNPVCAPTRASLLTGRNFLRTGVSHVHGGKDFLNLQERTIGNLLGDAGYATGIWGKWHSGHTNGYYPWQRGFDEAYMARLYKHRDTEGLFNGEPVKHNKWADEVITGYALDFIQRNQGKPFLAYLSFLTCHSPLDAPEDYVDEYMAKGLSKNLATLYGMIEHLDYQLGKFFGEIEEKGMLENTIIFFLSDNGPAILNNLLTDEDRELRYVNRLTGHKGNIWENGVKSPLFVRWDGHAEPGVSTNLVDVTDICPTLLSLAGIEQPDLVFQLDGVSFAEVLAGRENDRKKPVFNYANPGWPPTDLPWSPEGTKDEYAPVHKSTLAWDKQIISVTTGNYKLLLNPGKTKSSVDDRDGYVLINIMDDPTERINLASDEPQLTGELSEYLQDWFEGVLKEEGSFGMPVFQIGYSGSDESVIKGKGPSAISPGLKNIFNMLKGFDTPGEWAEYRINVVTPGEYRVSLEFSDIQSPDCIFSVETAGDTCKAPGLITLGPDEDWIRIRYLDGVCNLDLENLLLQPAE